MEAWRIAAEAVLAKKGEDISVLDLSSVASFTSLFVICNGVNPRQNQAISDEVEAQLREAGRRPYGLEGYQQAEWILLDYGDFIVHVFDDKARKFYDLERLWRESKQVKLPRELAGETDSSLRSEL